MADMTVTVVGSFAEAERACRMVFGENADLGPVRPAPDVLLEIVKKWPGRTDEAQDFSLELPWDFDVSKSLAKGHVMAVTIRACLVTVLHQPFAEWRGRSNVVGKAIRMDKASLGSLDAWERAWAIYNRKLAQAH